MAAAALRQAFLQADEAAAHRTWRQVADGFRPRWPKLAELMDAAEHEVLAYMGFPAARRDGLTKTGPARPGPPQDGVPTPRYGT